MPLTSSRPGAEAGHAGWQTRFRHELSARQAGHQRVGGLDESGRGPLAGPVVAACVILPDPPVHLEDLRDSKQLTPRRRRELAMRIHERALGVGVGVVDAQTIDRVNILQATFLAMHRAVESLAPAPDFLLIDGNRRPPWARSSQTLVGGENRSLSIAAASIIAKVMRDRIMEDYDQLFPQYGFGRHKGYGTVMHLQALRRHGPCELHRRSFQPLTQLPLTPLAP